MIRLVPTSAARPQLPTPPFASLALLLLSSVVIAGLFAASRGPGFRFATAVEAGAFSESDLVRITVERGGEVRVDGVVVDRAELGPTVKRLVAARPGTTATLIVAPEATYGDMLAAYGAIVSVDHPPVVALPTRAWLETRDAS